MRAIYGHGIAGVDYRVQVAERPKGWQYWVPGYLSVCLLDQIKSHRKVTETGISILIFQARLSGCPRAVGDDGQDRSRSEDVKKPVRTANEIHEPG
jgi:hypothetical protein